MIRASRRAWLVGLGLAVGIILATGGSAGANERPSPPTCSSPASSRSPFRILDNQTYALCAAASCFVFNEVAYCDCHVKSGDSISLKFDYDDGKNVCTVNEEGASNGYMVSTFSPPASIRKPDGDQASYTCPGGSDGAYAQCDGGICFKNTQGKSYPGFDKPLGEDEIICSCPITEQTQKKRIGYQIIGPYPCQKSFFENCKRKTANEKTGSTLHVGAPTGTADLLTFLLTGAVPPTNKCTLPRD